jgi:uncharacterized ubiquitin-like protein YukD
MDKQEILELLYNLISNSDDMQISSEYGTTIRVVDKDNLLTLINKEMSNYQEDPWEEEL